MIKHGEVGLDTLDTFSNLHDSMSGHGDDGSTVGIYLQNKAVFFPTLYLQVNISIISAGELGIFDFATGNPSREIRS